MNCIFIQTTYFQSLHLLKNYDELYAHIDVNEGIKNYGNMDYLNYFYALSIFKKKSEYKVHPTIDYQKINSKYDFSDDNVNTNLEIKKVKTVLFFLGQAISLSSSPEKTRYYKCLEATVLSKILIIKKFSKSIELFFEILYDRTYVDSNNLEDIILNEKAKFAETYANNLNKNNAIDFDVNVNEIYSNLASAIFYYCIQFKGNLQLIETPYFLFNEILKKLNKNHPKTHKINYYLGRIKLEQGLYELSLKEHLYKITETYANESRIHDELYYQAVYAIGIANLNMQSPNFENAIRSFDEVKEAMVKKNITNRFF